jgi:hypothetical protein
MCSIESDHHCSEEKARLRLNMVLKAETAKMLHELRERGIIRSYADGVNQAIQTFYDRILERDLRSARFRVLQTSQNESE